MNKPKLIFLNGFAASGKTTLTKRYLQDHPLALGFEHDELISMFGEWRTERKKATDLKLLHTRNIVKTHLQHGYDVILPFLLEAPEHAAEYEAIASETGALFYEFCLALPKEEAVARLLKRGSWGEPGSPLFTDNDTLFIEEKFDRMQSATKQRPNTIYIEPKLGAIEHTYQELLSRLAL